MPAEKLAPFTIARVLTAERHPQADKLQVLTVDTGEQARSRSSAARPMRGPGWSACFGASGRLCAGQLDVTLKVAAIRGVESNGMMCSARELRARRGP